MTHFHTIYHVCLEANDSLIFTQIETLICSRLLISRMLRNIPYLRAITFQIKMLYDGALCTLCFIPPGSNVMQYQSSKEKTIVLWRAFSLMRNKITFGTTQATVAFFSISSNGKLFIDDSLTGIFSTAGVVSISIIAEHGAPCANAITREEKNNLITTSHERCAVTAVFHFYEHFIHLVPSLFHMVCVTRDQTHTCIHRGLIDRFRLNLDFTSFTGNRYSQNHRSPSSWRIEIWSCQHIVCFCTHVLLFQGRVHTPVYSTPCTDNNKKSSLGVTSISLEWNQFI